MELIAALRRQFPASIAVCRDAIVAANGDLKLAAAIVKEHLVSDFRARTGTTQEEAIRRLQLAAFDVERAIYVWHLEHPTKRTPEQWLAEGVSLAASLPTQSIEMQCYTHVIRRGDKFEIRLIKHHERFTETEFGLDYDVALEDPRTRIRCFTATDDTSLIEILSGLGITYDSLLPARELDSCLLNSPIDAYLKPGRIPHLTLDDEDNLA